MNEYATKQTVTRKRFRDKHKEKRIYEHLTNKNDIISEEDIQRVITDISLTSHGTHSEIGQHHSHSSWNVLGDSF